MLSFFIFVAIVVVVGLVILHYSPRADPRPPTEFQLQVEADIRKREAERKLRNYSNERQR